MKIQTKPNDHGFKPEQTLGLFFEGTKFAPH